MYIGFIESSAMKITPSLDNLSFVFFAGITNFLDRYSINTCAGGNKILVSYFVTFLPISLSTSFKRSRATNCSMSGNGFPAGQPSSGVVLD